jgi:hypoxanthine phosphoribosyltransferase
MMIISITVSGKETLKEMRRVYISWYGVHNWLQTLVKANRLHTNTKIKSIYGLPRGGLVPAVILSHMLEIPLVSEAYIRGDTLIVDDICDTGETLKRYEIDKCPTLTIHYKRSAIIEPTYWCMPVEEDQWIVYPWEKEDSETIADYKK